MYLCVLSLLELKELANNAPSEPGSMLQVHCVAVIFVVIILIANFFCNIHL